MNIKEDFERLKNTIMYNDFLRTFIILSSTYKCNFLGADNKQ